MFFFKWVRSQLYTGLQLNAETIVVLNCSNMKITFFTLFLWLHDIIMFGFVKKMRNGTFNQIEVGNNVMYLLISKDFDMKLYMI